VLLPHVFRVRIRRIDDGVRVRVAIRRGGLDHILVVVVAIDVRVGVMLMPRR
jgi:hypothetical protein